MSSENVALIRAIYDAFAAGDVPGVLSRMSPDIVWNEAESFIYADGNPYRGPEAVLNGVFARIGAEWDGFEANVEELIDGGDTIVALGRYRGIHKATGGASTPSLPTSGGSRTARPRPSSNIPTRCKPPAPRASPERDGCLRGAVR